MTRGNAYMRRMAGLGWMCHMAVACPPSVQPISFLSCACLLSNDCAARSHAIFFYMRFFLNGRTGFLAF